jgi:hypothetical protein
MRRCNKCNRTIPKGRIEALPDTTTCVKCSGVRRAKTIHDVDVDSACCDLDAEEPQEVIPDLR